MIFKIGDKVKLKEGFKDCYRCRCDKSFKIAAETGERGIIIFIFSKEGYKYAIEFERNIKGHNCNGKCPQDFGQNICENHLELAESESSAENQPIGEAIKNKMKKETKIKVWVVIQKDSLMNWLPQSVFTGHFAVFESEKKAKLAIQYNRNLEKASGIKRRQQNRYKVISFDIRL